MDPEYLDGDRSDENIDYLDINEQDDGLVSHNSIPPLHFTVLALDPDFDMVSNLENRVWLCRCSSSLRRIRHTDRR
jgi:hypothetical protein